MVKSLRRLLLTNCLSVFNHLLALVPKGLSGSAAKKIQNIVKIK